MLFHTTLSLLLAGALCLIATASASDDHRKRMSAAAELGDTGALEKLIQEGADVNNPHWTLERAARRGHVDFVRMLLQNGADANPVNAERCTPLNSAIGRFCGHVTSDTRQRQRDYERIVELLIHHGADVNICCDAARSGPSSFVELLLRNGADVHATNSRGETALRGVAKSIRSPFKDYKYFGSRENDIEKARLLLRWGAAPSAAAWDAHAAWKASQRFWYGAISPYQSARTYAPDVIQQLEAEQLQCMVEYLCFDAFLQGLLPGTTGLANCLLS